MSAPERSEQGSRKRRCKAACRQCRQSKVKCGMEQTPCARCQRLGYDCEWDPQFKRTRNADRFIEMEQRIRSLQAAGASENRQDAPTPTSTSRVSTSQRPSSSSIPQRHPQETGTANTPDSETSPSHDVTTHFTFRNVKLSVEDASGLFAKFFDKYHPCVPFLTPGRSPHEVYHTSEFLFWSIISVAAREQQPEKNFLSDLAPYFVETLGSIIFAGTAQLSHVQALVLVALWPPSNITMWGERSVVIANLAATGALFLGLHNPCFEQEYTNIALSMSYAERTERTRTWCAVVSVAQNLAMDYGLPVRLPFANWKLQELSNVPSSPGIPIELQHYLIIQQHAYNTFITLPERGDAAASSPFDDALLGILHKADIDLHKLTHKLTNMSLLNRFRYAIVQLHLRSMHFHVYSSSVQRKQGVINAYNTAIYIVNMMVSEDGSSDVLTYSPRTTFRGLMLAAGIIFKVLHSSYGTEVDYNSGKILFNAALLCMRQQSVQYRERKDLPLRCVDFMKELWHLGEISPSMLSSQPELAIQTRFGASVIYHCLAVFFDRIALFYRQREQGDSNNIALQLSDNFDAMAVPDMDPQLAFADFFPMDFAWDPSRAQPDLQYYL